MKLKKASAWFYNKSKNNIVLADLNIIVRKWAVVDLFVIKPDLSYEAYLKSAKEGSIRDKKTKLIKLDGPPVKNDDIITRRIVSEKPISSRTKSTYGLTGKVDYISVIEEEFPADAVPLQQEDLWNMERKKMLENLERGGEQGFDGEVFDDDFLDSSPDED